MNDHPSYGTPRVALELSEINRFATKAHLIEAIYQNIYYYNHKRIHTKLKMSPYNFAKLTA